MNTDAEHNLSLEEEFAALEQPPVTLVALPDPTPEFEPEVDPFTPTESAVSTPEPETAPNDHDTQAESILADIDTATETLARFRAELVRLVELQRTTETELEETRRRLLETEAELSRERDFVSTVRDRLGELVASIDQH